MAISDYLMTPNGAVSLYTAAPDGEGPCSGVVVIHDVLGVTNKLQRHLDWLASAGFLAVAPDLYSCDSTLTFMRATFRAIAERKGVAFDDIEAARAALAARSDCTGKDGIIGFCMSGGFALVAAVDRGFAASSVNYGAVPKDVATFLSDACPIIGSYGGKDRGFKGAAAQLEMALAINGVDHDVVEYPQASHCFLGQFGGFGGWLMGRVGFGYHPVEAADARERIVRFFVSHLRTAPSPA